MCIPRKTVLAEHVGVKEVAVVGFTKWREGEDIAAFVVPSSNLTEAECRARLSSDKRSANLCSQRNCRATSTARVLGLSFDNNSKAWDEPLCWSPMREADGETADPPLIRPASSAGVEFTAGATDVTVMLIPRWRPVALHRPRHPWENGRGLC